MRHLKRHLTYANVMATLAIFLAFGGSAYAAIVITGKNVKDGTLSGADVRNGTLSAADLSLATRSSFKGPKGNTGPTGIRGLTGEPGAKGDTGAPGAPAEVVTSYASRDTGFIVRNTWSPPNPSGAAWWDYNCGGLDTQTADCSGSGSNGNQRGNGVGQIELNPAGVPLIALSGVNIDPDETAHTYSSANNIVVPWSSNLTGMMSISMLHRGAIHDRFQCELQYANVASPTAFASLGAPQVVSAFQPFEVVSMSLVGSKNVPAGSYNVRIMCFDLDDHSGNASWRFIKGNLTAMAARNG